MIKNSGKTNHPPLWTSQPTKKHAEDESYSWVMKIAIDIDDTICCTWETYFDYATRFNLEKNLTNNPVFIDGKHDIADVFGWSEKLTLDFEQKYYADIIASVLPKPLAAETIVKLKSNGHEIIFLTARLQSHCGIDVFKLTTDWLNKNGFVYDQLICAGENKGKAIKDKKVEILIDDSPKYCLSAYEMGVKTIMFNGKFNRNFNDERITRVKTWAEMLQYKIVDVISWDKENDTTI